MYNSIVKILTDNNDKRIAIISHGTAITFLLKKWCNTEILIKSINEFLNAIKLNEENLQKFLNEISDDSYDSEQNKN